MRGMIQLFLVLVTSVGLVSCAGGRNLRKSQVGTEQVVERIPAKAPKWIEIPFEEKKDVLFFKGEATGISDSALGLRQAKAHGVQNLLEAIQIRARSEFSEAVRGVNASHRSLGRYLDSVVAWTTDNLEVAGIQPAAEYREKILVQGGAGVEYRYNVYVRLSISREDYRLARRKALERALTEFQDDEARRLALEAKEKLDR